MRTRCAAVWALMVWPSVALAGEPHAAQMLVQTGINAKLDGNGGSGAGGAVGVLWTPWRSSGMWAEVGVMDVPNNGLRIAVLGLSGVANPVEGSEAFQHFDVSAGLIAISPNASGGFLRAGVGAYRIQTDDPERKVLVSTPVEHLPMGAPFTLTRWTMAGSVGAGLRFGSESMRALPTVEARLTYVPGESDQEMTTLSLTGGIWFR